MTRSQVRTVAVPMSRPKVAFTVRRFEPADGPAVCRIWKAGFLEMVRDLTRNLGAVGSPEHSVSWPRPVLALAAAAGAARTVVALLRRESSPRARNIGLVVAGVGVTGLAALHFITYKAISSLCDHECEAGDMRDIRASWQQPGVSEFYVAVDQSGAVLGCVAVRKGHWREEFEKHSTAAAPPAVKELDAECCSVWKVSTASSARGSGIAKALMARAEDWAKSQGARRMVLVTASPGAKAFYARQGYALDGGSASGAQFSSWAKELTA